MAEPARADARRAAALARYGILDTPPEALFDDIAQLAADALNAPIAVVNFVSGDRQWFKAEVGIGKRELPMDVSICRHVVLQTELVTAPDLAGDPRFRDNPLVQAAEGLRFYAGAPLLSPDGLAIGTVCVLDTKPRPEGLSDREQRVLRVLAAHVMSELELRRAVEERDATIAAQQAAEIQLLSREEQARRDAALLAAVEAASANPTYAKDLEGRVIYANRALLDALGRSMEATLGRTNAELVGSDEAATYSANDRHVLESGQTVVSDETFTAPDGRLRRMRSTKSPLRSAEGDIVGLVGVSVDVTEERERAAAVEESRRLLDAVLQALPVGVIIADREGRIVGENAANRELWGVSPETTSWEGYGEWVGYWPATGERIKADEWAMSRALLHGEVVTGELVECERFGTRERRSYLNNAAPVRDASGRIIAGVVAELDVTERLAVERALRQTEERYRLAAQATNDAIWDWDLETGAIIWNEAVATLFGHRDAVSGSTADWWLAHIHPDDRGKVDLGVRQVIESAGSTWTEEYRFRRADGGYAHVLDRGTVLRDEGGRGLRMIGAMQDLSERKRAEAVLRESEATFRDRLNAIPQMVWSTLPDGYHDFYNDRWYEFTGVEQGSTDGEGWNDMFHPDDQPRALALWRRSLEAGEPYEIEYRLRHRSGQHRWVLGRALPIRDAKGKIIRWMGTCTDIDDLRRTADELQRTSALLRLIGDSTPDMIYAKDFESRVIYANDAVRRVIGKPPQELLGRSDRDWAADSDEAEAIIANDRRVMERGETVDLDEVFTGPDGVTRHFRSVKSPLRDAAGATIGLVGVTSDVTARKRAEERERLLAREVDHRAKNLLAVVQSVIQLTRADDIDAFTTAIVGRIHSLARAHSLLAASRWEGADLGDMVAEELAPFAGREGRVRMEGPAAKLRPDAAQALALAVHELATNAAKYGALSADAGTLQVEWSFQPDGRDGDELVLVWLEEGGPAVTPPSRRGFGSTVLRASIERQLKGTVQLDWRPEGLACRLAIPIEQAAAQGASALPHAGPVPAAKPAANPATNRRVMVLEDEALISLQVEEAVRAAGHRVIGPASRIGEAFDLLHAEKPDAAVLDVMVAGERSFALADALRSEGVPFAFLTGFDASSTLPGRFSDVPVLNKPFSPADLADVLQRL